MKRALASAKAINELLKDVSPQDVVVGAPTLVESLRQIASQGKQVISRSEELLGGEGSGVALVAQNKMERRSAHARYDFDCG